MACDICGKTGVELEDLLKSYATKQIQQVCPGCLKTVNKQLWDIKELSTKFTQTGLKRFMRVMRRKLTSKKQGA